LEASWTHTYRFADIEVDLARMQVRRGGEDVALEPKAFDLLRFLIEHRDRLVTKDELLDHVWRDTFVTPNALTRAVAQLRKALGDEAREARIIETAAKRGYRFIAVVDQGTGREVSESDDPAAQGRTHAAASAPDCADRGVASPSHGRRRDWLGRARARAMRGSRHILRRAG
jgi:DNA-binding winged helix-turn-helix (wHTH) protein